MLIVAGCGRVTPIPTIAGWVGVGRVATAVATSPTVPDQLETLLRRLLPTPVLPIPPPKPVPSDLELLLRQLWGGGAQTPKPPLPVRMGITAVETLLQNLLPVRPTQLSTLRRDWSTVLCFSCGKPGHGATWCPTLNEAFLFKLPGWKAEKAGCGYAMISPRVAVERRRAENGDWSGEGGQPT